MSADIGISPAITALIGADLAERLRTQDAHSARGACDVCGLPTDPDLAPVNLVLRVYPATIEAAGKPTPSFVTIPRHRACGDSEVLPGIGAPPDDTDDVTVQAASWPDPGGPDRPILLVSFPNTAGIWTETGESDDPLVGTMTAKGWDQVSRMGRSPQARPDAVAEWRFDTGARDLAGPGRLVIHEPGTGSVIADVAQWWASEQWTLAVGARGRVDVYCSGAFGIGRIAPEELTLTRLNRTAKNGRVTAASLPFLVFTADGEHLPPHTH